MINMSEKEWYIKYNSEITEDVFNRLITGLISKGLIFKKHYTFNLNYRLFKEHNFIRSYYTRNDIAGEGRHLFCIDNNKQNILDEIMVEDIISLIPTQSYEIY